ncbi:MAG: hypothetical protein ABI432_16740 [Flavobacteriales bacterium]
METPQNLSSVARDTDLGHALSLRAAGVMEVLRITRRVRTTDGGLRYAGVPGSSSSNVRGLEVSFIAEGTPPPPILDPISGFIRLFYPSGEQHEVQQLLESKRHRFCYFWRSRDEAFRHAWLLSSP